MTAPYAPYRMSIADKLAFHSIPEPNSGCLLWTGNLDTGGYASFRHHRKTIRAHRVAWELANGALPAGLFVCHKCDVRSCINPSHLFLGTHADNMRDMARKNRHGRPKLTPAQALEIRADIREQKTIAAEYGVDQSLISRIRSGTKWCSV